MKDYVGTLERSLPFFALLFLAMMGIKVYEKNWQEVFELTSYFFFGVALVWVHRRWG